MRYSIGRIAKMLGLSAETVRTYERKGIVHPHKNPENGYRTFHVLDIGTILRCRSYTCFGLSLNEAAETINSKSVAETHSLLAQQEKHLASQIEQNQRLLNRLHDLNQVIEHCENLVNTLHFTGATSNVIGEGTNMYVNQDGKRFVDESSRRDVLAKAILAQPGSYCYIISTFWNSRMDADYKNNYHLYLDDLIASGAVVKADTLEELAEKIGCPVETFVETCTNFNEYAANSYDPECGRVVFPDNAALEMEGPFYACKRAPAVHHTMGGIEVNTKNQVVAEKGGVIAGLYAAGEVTGGFHGSNRLAGNAVSEIVTTGRNAAKNLLAE